MSEIHKLKTYASLKDDATATQDKYYNTGNKNIKATQKMPGMEIFSQKNPQFSNTLEDIGRALTFSSKSGVICHYIYMRPFPVQNHAQNTLDPREESETHLNFRGCNCFQDRGCFNKSRKECLLPTDQPKLVWSH